MKRANQYKPCPPDDMILPIVEKLYMRNRSDPEILEHILRHIDTDIYGMSVKSLKRFRVRHELLSTRQQGHTPESIAPYIAEIRTRLPSIGTSDMVVTLRQDYKIHVSHGVVLEYFRLHEPDALRARKQNRLKRRRFWATGVNDIWAVDQHDKWKRFGLWLHLGVEVYSGKTLWLKVWWANRKPQLLCRWYCEVAREFKCIPLLTQSDPGKENVGVAYPHSVFRHTLDPSLVGTIQHQIKRDGMNIKPEIKWSVFRRQLAPGFETLFDEGLIMGWYRPEDTLHLLTFRWLVIPWMQVQLDNYRIKQNNKLPRKDNKKFLPHGIPDMIFENPQDFGTQDYKVQVTDDLIDAVEQQFAPHDHPAFQLVPQWLDVHLRRVYTQTQQPAVTVQNLWAIFGALVEGLRNALSERQLQALYDLELIDPEEYGELPPMPGNYVERVDDGFHFSDDDDEEGVDFTDDEEGDDGVEFTDEE